MHCKTGFTFEYKKEGHCEFIYNKGSNQYSYKEYG